MAELTNPTKSATEEVLTEQLADVLASKWDKFTTSPVFDRPQQTARSPSPRRKVTFVPPREQSPVPGARYNNNNFRPTYVPRQAFTGNRIFQGPRPRIWTPRPTAPSFIPTQAQAPANSSSVPGLRRQSVSIQCPKCGRNPHQNFNQCPAINKFCALCGRRGHFVAVCRLAQRTQQTQQFSE